MHVYVCMYVCIIRFCRRRSSQELYVALEEVQLKRRLSQAMIHFLQKHYKSLHKQYKIRSISFVILRVWRSHIWVMR